MWGVKLRITVSDVDAEVIIKAVNGAYGKIPLLLLPLIKLYVPTTTSILNKLPECVKKYTLQELIDLLRSAQENGRIP